MRCFKCKKIKCHTKIICYEPAWEFGACDDHIKDLEQKSNTELGKGNGVMRNHITSTSPVKRELVVALIERRWING